MYIYEIKNLINNKVYIGQTIQEPKRRWIEHKRDLNKGNHSNCHLQNAWNKYGSLNWSFRIIDKVKSQRELNRLEEQYIKKNKNGYNIREGGSNGKLSEETKNKISKSLLGKKHSSNSKKMRSKTRRPEGYPVVISPTGKEHKIEDLTNFCKKYKLHCTGMFDLVNKKAIHYKNWTLKGTTLPSDLFDLISLGQRPSGYPSIKSPSGKIYKDIINLRRFCRENNLTATNLHAVIKGKAKSHKGWTLN